MKKLKRMYIKNKKDALKKKVLTFGDDGKTILILKTGFHYIFKDKLFIVNKIIRPTGVGKIILDGSKKKNIFLKFTCTERSICHLNNGDAGENIILRRFKAFWVC